MTALHQFAGYRSVSSLVGMKVTASKSIIGTVINVMQNNNMEIERVEIRKDRDYSVIAVHPNRIDGIDEESRMIVVN